MNKLEIEILSKCEKYKLSKSFLNEFLRKALKELPVIKIGNSYYKFNLNKEYVRSSKKVNYITPKTKKYKIFKSLMSYIEEVNEYVVERFIGLEIYYNGLTFDYKYDQVGLSVYSIKRDKFYYFRKGFYVNFFGESFFNLIESKFVRKKIDILDLNYFTYLFICNIKSLVKVKNKYHRQIKKYIPLADYVMLLKHPKLETIYKRNEDINLKRNSFNKWFLENKLEFDYKTYLKCSSYGYYKMAYLFFLKFKSCNFKDYLSENFISSFMSLNEKYQKLDILNYILRHENKFLLCLDYYRMLEGVDGDYPLKPKNIEKAHNDLLKTIRYKQEKELEEKINKINKVNRKLEFDYNDYKYFIPDVKEMVNYSTELNLCILKAGYIERVARNNCILLFCEKKENPNKLDKFACELSKKENGYEIIQFHGFNNDLNSDEKQKIKRINLLNILKDKLKEMVR